MRLSLHAMLLLLVLACLAAESLSFFSPSDTAARRYPLVPVCSRRCGWPGRCKGGYYRDHCGCRQCAKVEREACGYSGRIDQGQCDTNLSCVGGVCKGTPCPESLCFDDGPKNCTGGGVRDRCGCRVCAKVEGELCGQHRGKHHGYCDVGLRCDSGECWRPPCPFIICPEPTNCKGGVVEDRCCPECAKLEGETCNHREVTDQGTCDAGLECIEGVCKPFKRDCTLAACWVEESRLKCKGGRVQGSCHCDVCAKVEGETCGFKGWNDQGKCDRGLVCYKGVCKPPTNQACEHNGEIYQSGESFMIECNRCFCANGHPLCTKKGCLGFTDPPQLTKAPATDDASCPMDVRCDDWPNGPMNCKGRGVRDRCGCRVCAKVDGETCGHHRGKHLGYCDLGLECGSRGYCYRPHCAHVICPEPTNCKGGVVEGSCNCDECAKLEGETCNHTEVTDKGTCDAGLECIEGVCKPYRAICHGLACSWEKVLKCKGGRVVGSCGCHTCGKVKGESCGFKGWNDQGKCERGLVCYKGVCKQTTDLRTCEHNGKTYKHGQFFKEDCRQCYCFDGFAKCFLIVGCRGPTAPTLTEAPETAEPTNKKTCEHNGKTYQDGEGFMHDCNGCTCYNGHARCTLKMCHDFPNPSQLTEAPDTNDICSMPKKIGWCRMRIPSYYFDISTNECQSFNYGGCGGNKNRFPSREECEGACIKDICSMPKKAGFCYMDIPSYYFDISTNKCQSFSYGGCGGNKNRFPSREKCESACIKEPTNNKTCEHNGKIYQPGEHYKVDCNWCTCQGLCTLKGCGFTMPPYLTEAPVTDGPTIKPLHCHYEDKFYPIGRFTDECSNSCYCKPSGEAYCITKIGCFRRQRNNRRKLLD